MKTQKCKPTSSENLPALFDYQKKMLASLTTLPAAGVVLKMGQGKTRVILEHLASSERLLPALIIAPRLVSQTTWPSEIAKWLHSQYQFTVLTGLPASTRLNAIAPTQLTHFTMITPDLVPWLVEQKLPQFNSLIVDESTLFKDPRAARTKALAKLSKQIPNRYLLTGCPDPQGLENLWSQAYVLDHGLRLGASYSEFMKSNFYPAKTHPRNIHVVFKWEPLPLTKPRVSKVLGDIFLTGERFGADNPVQAPAYIPEVLPASTQYLEAKNALAKKHEYLGVVPTHSAHLSGMMRQLAGGFLYGPDKDPIPIHEAKIEWLKEKIEDINEPILVAYWFQAEHDALLQAFPKRAKQIKTAADEAAWNRGEIPIGLIQPQSAGRGLNLQQGGAVLVWYSLPWSSELYSQTVARLARTGQTKPVRVFIPLLQESTDDAVYQSLLAKANDQEITREALTAIGIDIDSYFN